MPRQARLDAPGLLQHVMARGIERREIFRDDTDRRSFLDRLAVILDETQTQCYDWALIPNHYHLLLRTTLTPLPTVMRSLMTGYAITFNKRHRRAGHLFQNRYKSVVCEEDNYLLELTRYIHLNPLRAELVKDLKDLDKYPWSGHSSIIGKCENPLVPKKKEPISADELMDGSRFHQEAEKAGIDPQDPVKREELLSEKTIEDVLLNFGETIEEARKKYRQFVKDGIERGSRPELQGGGLIRSSGGSKASLLGLMFEEREQADQRILGSGEFVANALKASNDSYGEASGLKRISLHELSKKVSSSLDIKEEELRSPMKKRSVTRAKSVFGYLSIKKMGYTGREVGTFLNIRGYSAIRRAEEGEKIIGKYPHLWDLA